MGKIDENIIAICKQKLIQEKSNLLNKRKQVYETMQTIHHIGDEVDLSISMIEEHQCIVRHERILNQLYEIDAALGRIEQGVYGICEETFELIESPRLLTIPWTRLSIEGAEIREHLLKNFAK